MTRTPKLHPLQHPFDGFYELYIYKLYDRELEALSQEERNAKLASLTDKELTHAEIVEIEIQARPQCDCVEWYK